MARTEEEIRADLIAEHPTITVVVDGEEVVLDPNDPETADEYDAQIEEWTQNTLAMETAQETKQQEDAVDQLEQRGIVEKGKWLEETATKLEDTTQTMTIQQLRNVVAEGFRITADIIRYLNKHADQPVVEPEPQRDTS